MSFQELLAELPSLTPEQRDLLRVRLAERAGEQWMDADELTPAEMALIEERLAEHERNPTAAFSLEAMEARLRARFSL
ncbi:MAG: hypothetical protein WDM96_00760 [Lacunisphaera sp.]